MNRGGVRTRTVVAAAALLSAAAAAALAAPPATPPAAPPCRYPGVMALDRWVRLPTPPGVTTVSVQQLDQDPCVLVAADSTGARWRTTDAGSHWSAAAAGPATTRLWSERLQPRAGADPIGPLLAVDAPEDGDGTGQPQVYVSDDDGVTFAPAQLAVGAGTLVGPAEWATPLRMDLAAVATAVRYVGGKPQAHVYAAGRATTTLLPTLPAGETASLLKSTDGGHTFRSVDPSTSSDPIESLDSAQRLSPSAIAINPTSQEEVWVNDVQPGGQGGGAWVSYDGGATFTSACCPEATVRDIAVSATPDGGIVVLLATDAGLIRSIDDGKTWETVTDTAFTGIRTPADDPSTMLATTTDGVVVSTGPTVDFTPVPGLPGSCPPHQLRRNDRVPSTFLVDCGGRTYRLLLTKYTGSTVTSGASTPAPTPPRLDPRRPGGRPLAELAHWRLPGSNPKTAAIAFDGKVLYYDMTTPGDIGRVRASDGAFLGVWHTDLTILSMTDDLRRNQLIVASATGDLVTIDLATRKVGLLGLTPTLVPTYDSFTDGLSWIAEHEHTLFRRSRDGDAAGNPVCEIPFEIPTSTFLASGDGGGYVQSEDDQTIHRIDRTCRVLQTFQHRVFSESEAENDAMACDTQSYFPQPAIWIRDSFPQTVSAYGVPFGYCPMPSRLTLVLPREVVAGSVISLCADLGNATNGDPAINRGVEIAVSGAVVGHGQTDANGRVCVPYVPAGGFVGRRDLPVSARFAGDSALYPSSAKAVLGVLDALPVPPVPRQVAVVVPPPPYAPAIPANPAPNPGPAGAPGQAPAPNAANAPAGQAQANAQPIAQGVVVPQRQQQPQLALARAANQIGLENNQMVAPAQRRRQPVPPGGAAVAGLLAMCCFATVGAARLAFAPGRSARAPSRVHRRARVPAPVARRWR